MSSISPPKAQDASQLVFQHSSLKNTAQIKKKKKKEKELLCEHSSPQRDLSWLPGWAPTHLFVFVFAGKHSNIQSEVTEEMFRLM